MGLFRSLRKVLGGGVSGALPGFLLGGPVGALVGGGLGALSGATAKSPKQQKVSRYTPEQEMILNQMMREGASDASGAGMEKRYMDVFQREIVPDLAAQFMAMGGSGGRSSAFGETLGMAGSDLASKLAALRSQTGLQRLQLGMQPRFDTQYIPGQPGIGGQALGSLIPLLGLNMMMGGGGMLGGLGRGAKGRRVTKGGGLYATGQPVGYTGGGPLGSLGKLLMGR